MKYLAHYIHKIAPRNTDTEGPFELRDGVFSDKNTLAKAMRDAGNLLSGERLREFRVEGEKVITFPAGRSSIWHAIILVPADSGIPHPSRGSGDYGR